MAFYWYPKLKTMWLQNPADYYTITNEQGSNDPQSLQNVVNYEREVMKLANADGFKVCVLNLSTGSPGDFDMWTDICAPFIVEAWNAGNTYGRHVYGGEGGDLVDTAGEILPGNPQRPIEELSYLLSLDIVERVGGVFLTEVGIDAGLDYAGDVRYVEQQTGYEAALRPYPDVVAVCSWTLGRWVNEGNANMQTALPYLTAYNHANLTPRWEPYEMNQLTLKEFLWEESVKEQIARGIPLNPNAALQKEIYKDGLVAVHRERSPSYDDESYTIQAGEDLSGIIPRRVYVWQPGVPVWWFDDPQVSDPPEEFEFTHWPATSHQITQRFGENPEAYERWGLPGHDGVDIAASFGDPIYAAASGKVYRVERDPSSGNYGVHVRVEHRDNYKTIYAHLSSIPASIHTGLDVGGNGQIIGFAGNSGYSFGVHLHFGMKHPPGDPGWPYNLIDPWPFLAPLHQSPPPPSTGIDMLSFMRAHPTAWRVVRHSSGAQEDFRDYDYGDGRWVMVKNSKGEWWHTDGTYIYLIEDTSPGPTSDGQERCYKVHPGRWCKERMAIGETFNDGGHTVQFYTTHNCEPHSENSGVASNNTTVQRLEQNYTFNGFGQNITLDEVLFVKGNTETQIFARHQGKALGRVGWSSPWGGSEIVELYFDRGVLAQPPQKCCA
jgi:murein DD-endopeptidase MepM/ murein hydrolase activator NlpD